ncbi:MAG: PAS domain-containing protein [Chloroflexi bacterium]|nr:PAS domain-containing protein [Chloroflexota bacterium]
MSALRGATSPKGISPKGVSNDATIGFDADGRILSASASAAAVLGYARPQDMEGLALSALIGENAAGGMLLQTRSAGEPERTQAATEAGGSLRKCVNRQAV